jgi:hypothetical protein
MRVHFRGNLFTEPLSNNELFRLSGVMSHYEPDKYILWQMSLLELAVHIVRQRM